MKNKDRIDFYKEDIFKYIPDGYKQYIYYVIAEASLQNIPLFLVGGYVRDYFLGINASDLDLVIEGDAIELAIKMKKEYEGKLLVHKKFNTAEWKLPGNFHATGLQAAEDRDFSIDFISARKETYKFPGALPTIKFSSVEDDISRRDFSINTLAIDLTGRTRGKIIDRFNGINDIQTGVIRVLHPNSFIDDPTRLIRAIRYEKRFGFCLSSTSEKTIPKSLDYMKNVSGSRIRHELELVLEERNPASIIERLTELNILPSIHPSLPNGAILKKRLSLLDGMETIDRIQYGWMLWLLEADSTEINQIDRRLHFKKKIIRDIINASLLYKYISLSKVVSIPNWISKLEECSPDSIRVVYLACEDSEKKHILNEYLERWMNFKTYSDGELLKRKGLIPGPYFKEVLSELRKAWIAGKITTKKMEEEFLDILIDKQKRRER